jgi:hypothetical protein
MVKCFRKLQVFVAVSLQEYSHSMAHWQRVCPLQLSNTTRPVSIFYVSFLWESKNSRTEVGSQLCLFDVWRRVRRRNERHLRNL